MSYNWCNIICHNNRRPKYIQKLPYFKNYERSSAFRIILYSFCLCLFLCMRGMSDLNNM